MIRIRFQFTKTDFAACLSHLDTIRTLERACRRAQLPLAYSQGFNPRPRLAFGPALPVGTESLAEFFEADLDQESCEPQEVMGDLNLSLPRGLRVVDAWKIPANTSSLSTTIAAARYRVQLSGVVGEPLREAVNEISRSEQWVVERRRKGPADVRHLIYDLVLQDSQELWFTLAVGDAGTLRPDDFLMALANQCQGCFDPDQSRIIRMGLFAKANEGFVPFDKYF